MSETIDYREFKVLEAIEDADDTVLTQREIAARAGFSVGTVKKTLSDLTARGLVAGGALSEKGFRALEPYRVKRAVFVAAGFGSRLVPITLNTPKPLVRVHGRRIIDSLIDAVIAAGIEEIYIVRGEDVWQMVGISYWSEEDGKKLVTDIPATFAMPGGKERYWDEVALRCYAEHYEVHVRSCSADDIVEIDTFKELQAIDSAYA